jgi:hypothetical protein
MKKLMAVAMAVGMLVGFAEAGPTWRACTVQEAAIYGASHVSTVTYKDFTNTTADSAETVTLGNVLSNDFVTAVAAITVTPYTGGSTNTDSLTMTAGDGTDADLYVTSMQLAEDSTPVRVKFGRASEPALTLTTRVWSNVVAVTYTTNATPVDAMPTTNFALTAAGTVQVQTNVTGATVADATLGQKLYTADDTIDGVFTPANNQAMDNSTAGEVRVYFRVWRP